MTATLMKKQTKEFIDLLDDNQISHFFDYVQEFIHNENLVFDRSTDKVKIFHELETLVENFNVPSSFDDEKELLEALDEKHGYFY